MFPAFFIPKILTYAWYAAVFVIAKVEKSPHPKAIFPLGNMRGVAVLLITMNCFGRDISRLFYYPCRQCQKILLSLTN